MILATIFSILKIIGIILLTILALLLLLVILILFIPVIYTVDIDYDEHLDLKARLKVLFGIVSLEAKYADEKDFLIKLFGHRIDKIELNDNYENKDSDLTEDIVQEEELYRMSLDIENEKSEQKKEKKGLLMRLKSKITDFINKVKKIISNIKEIILLIKSLFDEKIINKAFSFSKKHIIRLIKHIRPNKSNIKVDFGMDDPAKTGYLLAAVSPFYALYGKWLELRPDFCEKKFKVNGKAKGYFLSFVLLWHILRVYFNKNVKTIINKLNNRGVANNG